MSLSGELATVRVVLTDVEPDGVNPAGENLHDVPPGNPEQLSFTAESNPFCDLILTVADALWPGITVIVSGVTASE
jgi:hypothetical protein